mmetsp:Transcript_93446/g.302576  ORF Transcript_93446/g.302576 Transcript_93446/m.302576 type:complete len:231 (-) Transcript_93446:416-1108(-)
MQWQAFACSWQRAHDIGGVHAKRKLHARNESQRSLLGRAVDKQGPAEHHRDLGRAHVLRHLAAGPHGGEEAVHDVLIGDSDGGWAPATDPKERKLMPAMLEGLWGAQRVLEHPPETALLGIRRLVAGQILSQGRSLRIPPRREGGVLPAFGNIRLVELRGEAHLVDVAVAQQQDDAVWMPCFQVHQGARQPQVAGASVEAVPTEDEGNALARKLQPQASAAVVAVPARTA